MLPFTIKIEKGETEHISFLGNRKRNQTVILTVGRWSMSKKALILGLILTACQVLDGILTYIGIYLMGAHMEGNAFLRQLFEVYGTAPSLLVVKILAIALITWLTLYSHNHKWIRAYILLIIIVYLWVAILPWVYIISHHQISGDSSAQVEAITWH